MQTLKIAVLAGDGIGPEVIDVTMALGDQVAKSHQFQIQWNSFPWGTDYFLKHGRMMPEDAIEQLRPHDAILLGAIGHPDVPDHTTLNGLLLPIRRAFDQFICVRPSILYDGVTSPLRDAVPGEIDLLVFRENTEGEYANIGGRLYEGFDRDTAVQVSVFTREGCRRIMRAAF